MWAGAGAWRAAALASAVVSSPRVQRPSWGGAGPLSLRPVSVRPWAGGGAGGEQGSPDPLTPPRVGPAGAAWWFWPWGASCRLGGRTLPLPPSTLLRAGLTCRPSLGPPAPPAVAARRWLAGGGGGGWAGECPGLQFGSAVSG